MARPILLSSLLASAVALAFSLPAHSQVAVDAAQQIQALAPQLIAFSGSVTNLQNLANGLVQGTPVVLTTVSADGSMQTATIAAQAPLTPLEAARALEAARQQLIARGIASPTAQQLGTALVGGPLTTALGTFNIPGTVTGSINPASLTVQQQAAVPFGGSAANFQALNTGLTQGRAITLNAVGSTGAVQSLTFTVPGGPLTTLEATQALQLANQLLASQGITNPTPEQIRTALLGGALNTGTNSVAVQGVLQGRGAVSAAGAPAVSSVGTSFSPVTNTSASPNSFTSASPFPMTSASPTTTFTSASPTVGTSVSPTVNTSASPVVSSTAPASVGASNGAPSPAVQMQIRR